MNIINQDILLLEYEFEKLKCEYLYSLTKWHPESFRKCKDVMKLNVDKPTRDKVDFSMFGEFFIIYYGTEEMEKSVLIIKNTLVNYSYLDFCPSSICMDAEYIDKYRHDFKDVLKDILEKFPGDELVVNPTKRMIESMNVLDAAKSILSSLPSLE